MNPISRRSFFAIAGSAAAGLWLGSRANAQGFPFIMGCQSYSFREFTFEESIAKLKELGLNNMEFCSAHFPPDPAHQDLEQIKAAVQAAEVNILCYGVEGFAGEEEANRKKFEFARSMGIRILTADPAPNSFDSLAKLCYEFNVKIAIHNHGPGARYDKVQNTLDAVNDKIPLIGACVDTGHVIRSGEKPHEVINALGGRVLSMHLKDWTHGGEEQILGQGDMDLVAVARSLKAVNFQGPIMLEYENNPSNPVPDMLAGLENWRKAVAEA